MDAVRLEFKRFMRYTVAGLSTFFFDLFLLFVFIDYFHINYLVATSTAYLIAVTINYYLCRTHVFHGTERRVHTGYVYFVVIALMGMGIVTFGMFIFLEFLHMHYILARLIISAMVGIWNYPMNLFVNFKVAGVH